MSAAPFVDFERTGKDSSSRLGCSTGRRNLQCSPAWGRSRMSDHIWGSSVREKKIFSTNEANKGFSKK